MTEPQRRVVAEDDQPVVPVVGGHVGAGLVGADAAAEVSVALMEPRLGPSVELDHLGRHPALASPEARADVGPVARAVGGLKLPHLEQLGLGYVTPIAGVPPVAGTRGARSSGAGPEEAGVGSRRMKAEKVG